MKLATRRRRIPLPGGGNVSAVVALPPGFNGVPARQGRAGRKRAGSAPAVILAHGAGADMTSPFMSAVQTGLARAGFVAVKFNFPYAEARRRAPDPRPVLEACYRAVVDAVRRDRRLAPPWIAIGGKSMGGRIASHLAAAGAPIRALVLLGYPLHPTGSPERLRVEHLPSVTVPTLFVQGTRDPLCDLGLLRPVLARMARAKLHTVEGGDHSLRLPRRAGRDDADVWSEVAGTVARWLETLSA